VSDFPAALVAAAQFERDTRAERYPRLVADRKLDREVATVDHECWCVIAGWFETGQLASVDIDLNGSTRSISWAECEAAAEKALASVTTKADRLGGGDEDFSATHARRASLVCIHRLVKLRRESIDTLNAELRERREKAKAA